VQHRCQRIAPSANTKWQDVPWTWLGASLEPGALPSACRTRHRTIGRDDGSDRPTLGEDSDHPVTISTSQCNMDAYASEYHAEGGYKDSGTATQRARSVAKVISGL